jgi:D-alanyl-D-alanine carboxypeptidase
MKRTCRAWRFLWLVLLISIGNSTIAYADCMTGLEKDLQATIDADRAKFNIPGMEVSVLCPGERVPHDFVSGTTTINGNTLVTPKTLFQIGSETKSFIAVRLLQLEAEGYLSIDDPIGKWLPQLNSSWQKITIRQLLNHTSGIYNYTDVLDVLVHQQDPFDFSYQWSAADLIALVTDKPLYFAPGQGWHYSNTNYVLAGMIIEAATGHSVNQELSLRLIVPLQLRDTYYFQSPYTNDAMQRMAHGYSERGYFPDEPKDITSFNASWANAAGGMISTSHDTALWLRQLLQGSLLPRQQMKELLTFVDQHNGQTLKSAKQASGYGLGLIYETESFGEEAIWHSGSMLGYSALMVMPLCDGVVVTVTVNNVTENNDHFYSIVSHVLATYRLNNKSPHCKMTRTADKTHKMGMNHELLN